MPKGNKADLPNETMGALEHRSTFSCLIGPLLYSPDTRFVLAGHRQPEWIAPICPRRIAVKIRLIYRLTRTDLPAAGDHAVSPRLPMTLNLVLRTRGGQTRSAARWRRLTAPRIARRRWACSGANGR